MLLAATLSAASPEFSGVSALEFTKQIVRFGPRPPASPAIQKLQAWLIARLRQAGCVVTEDPFQSPTPQGPLAMKNIIVRIPGTSGRAVVLSGHYDTKLMSGAPFVGANDGGASAGFLLEVARVSCGKPRRDDLYLVWFDGEEAIGEWSPTDGIHGSRHLARKWSGDGTLARIKALINVDMIGDKDLGIMQEMNSTPWLRSLVWDTATGRGYGRYFLPDGGAVEDDHMPFLRAGVPAVDLIDFDYPPWHTPQDTLDKLSANSLQIVGNVLMEVVLRLEKLQK
jgi:Zn-dependent M28 family amino/carboxypeptidase